MTSGKHSIRKVFSVVLIIICLIPSYAAAGQDKITSQFLSLPVDGYHYKTWLDRGRILYNQMAYADALDAFKKIDRNAPPDIWEESAYLSANCLVEAGKYDDAASFAGAVSDKSRFYPFALYTMAMINIRQGKEHVAEGYLEDIIKYARTFQPAKVKSPGDKEMRQDDINALAYRANLTLGFINLEKENNLEALKHLSVIPRESPLYEKALFGLGWAYAGLDRWVRSVVIWEELFTLYPESTYSMEIVPYIGYAYTRLNAYGKAVEQNGIALSYYRDMSKKITVLKNAVKQGNYDKVSEAVNTYGSREMSTRLKLYEGLVQMEDYLGPVSPDTSPEIKTIISLSEKMRDEILGEVSDKVHARMELLLRQLLEVSVDTSIMLAQNLRLEGGGQISSDMTFTDHD